MIQSYRDLIAWQKAMDLVVGVYEVTRSWPKDEIYGLTNQVRRAAVSIPANVAEGKGRAGANEYHHHLSIAHGSLCELETQLQIAHRLGYLDETRLNPLLETSSEVGRIIQGIMRKLRPTPQRPTPPRPDA